MIKISTYEVVNIKIPVRPLKKNMNRENCLDLMDTLVDNENLKNYVHTIYSVDIDGETSLPEQEINCEEGFISHCVYNGMFRIRFEGSTILNLYTFRHILMSEHIPFDVEVLLNLDGFYRVFWYRPERHKQEITHLHNQHQVIKIEEIYNFIDNQEENDSDDTVLYNFLKELREYDYKSITNTLENWV